MLLLISLISARGGIRLVMMLVPAASILAAYLSVEIASLALNTEKSTKRTISIICAGIIIVAFIFSGYQFYKTSVATYRRLHSKSVQSTMAEGNGLGARKHAPKRSIWSLVGLRVLGSDSRRTCYCSGRGQRKILLESSYG